MSKKSTPTWHMRRALRLAKKARGMTLSNPMVGAVIIKNDERIGEGYHTAFGKPHAEIEALKSCSESAEGATMYVTLEPCSKTGKTPPCTKAIIESGIKKVVIAAADPSQNGIEELQAAGIEVEVGLLEDEARALNKHFFTFQDKKRPFITLKVAMSMDGKIAEKPGTQTQLTKQAAQKRLHKMRSEHEAILIGAGTALSDNPNLGVRLVEGKDPLRVILKGDRELPKNLEIFRDENYLLLKSKNMQEVMDELYKKGITSVLVEGGSNIFTELIESKLIDEFQIFIAPILLGADALPFAKISDKISLSTRSVRKLGPDVLITATPKWDSNNG